MPKLKVLPVLIALLLGTTGAAAGYQYKIYVHGLIAASCTGPWGSSMVGGQSVTAYQAGAVNYDQSCVSESRTCLNGQVSGSYLFQTCGVQTANDCNLQGYAVTHSHSVLAYSATTVPYTDSCDSIQESRTCTNGVLSGTFPNTSCTVTPEQSCTFNGTTVTSAAPVDAYSSATVAAGSTCDSVKETRSCTDGVLSGSYIHPTCVVQSCLPTGPQAYAYTGADQAVSVPAGCTTATIKAWGAGGGGGSNYWDNLSYGGGGGFASRTLSVTPGNTLKVVVGAKAGTNKSAYGGGGLSAYASSMGGAGGGMSGVFLSTVTQANALVVAGGGGGGGAQGSDTLLTVSLPAGAGGDTTAAAEQYANYDYYFTNGGSATSIVGGTPLRPGSYSGGAGTALRGGAFGTLGGGSGGGGYWGGGAGGGYKGGSISYYGGGGGGGGSNYAPGGTVIAGSGCAVANSADADYVAGVGNGGCADLTSGQAGRVVITWQ